MISIRIISLLRLLRLLQGNPLQQHKSIVYIYASTTYTNHENMPNPLITHLNCTSIVGKHPTIVHEWCAYTSKDSDVWNIALADHMVWFPPAEDTHCVLANHLSTSSFWWPLSCMLGCEDWPRQTPHYTPPAALCTGRNQRHSLQGPPLSGWTCRHHCHRRWTGRSPVMSCLQ